MPAIRLRITQQHQGASHVRHPLTESVGVWVEVLSLALARLGSSTAVTRGRSLMCTQQMGARLNDDYSGFWLPGPVLHAYSPLTPACSGRVLAYLFRIRQCW
jgi:hypothetical protein